MNIHVVLGKREGEINKLTALSDNGIVFAKASYFSLELGIPVPDMLGMVSQRCNKRFHRKPKGKMAFRKEIQDKENYIGRKIEVQNLRKVEKSTKSSIAGV